MNIEREWEYKLQQVKQSIEDFKKILDENELTRDMKMFCLSEIQKKTKYAELIEETLRRLRS